MKKTLKITLSVILAVLLLCTVACDKSLDTSKLWENATYIEDTTLGNGKNTVIVEIVAGERSVALTIKTDKATLGEAMYEHELVNDPSFTTTCNGMYADWSKNQAYWAFYVDDVMVDYGIANEKSVADTKHSYKLVYTK